MPKGRRDLSYDIYKVDDHANILTEDTHSGHGKNLGIGNGKIAINTPYEEVLSFQKLIAPPYISSESGCWKTCDFIFQGRCFGELIPTSHYVWHPFMIEREGALNSLKIKSRTLLVDGMRTVLMAVDVENQQNKKVEVPLQFAIKGGLDHVEKYGFGWALGKKELSVAYKNGVLTLWNDSGAIVATSDLPGLVWRDYSCMLETSLPLPAKGKKSFCLAVSIGPIPEATANTERVVKAYRVEIERTKKAWDDKVHDLFDRIPVLESDNADLVHFYNRSLLPFLLNRWEVDEFVLNPYYSTGGMNGGCIGSYLWDYGNPSKMWPLFDQASAKNHIRQFLSIDLTAHFAFSPGNGEAFGPWYPINQENIIALIYYYALVSGDRAFLNETANGRTVIDWVAFHALHKDNPRKDAVLVDYGTGNNHLELRKKYRYDRYIPDLNARRCASYKRAGDLFKWIGRKPPVDFYKRAQDLKPLIKEKCWDKKEKWFAWLGEDQKRRDLRYTYLIYEMFDTGALDKETEKGLLGHLNEREFLSDYGLHSISKKDPAYDQVDIDNGGGGACTCIETTIIERLYKAGYPAEAEAILGKILWWGTRLPYYTDSQVANYIAAREDSPLMNAVGALAGAQCIIWGLFGVEISPDFDLMINPKPTTLARHISLKGLKIRNNEIDIILQGNSFTVRVNGSCRQSHIGTPVKACHLK